MCSSMFLHFKGKSIFNQIYFLRKKGSGLPFDLYYSYFTLNYNYFESIYNDFLSEYNIFSGNGNAYKISIFIGFKEVL